MTPTGRATYRHCPEKAAIYGEEPGNDMVCPEKATFYGEDPENDRVCPEIEPLYGEDRGNDMVYPEKAPIYGEDRGNDRRRSVLSITSDRRGVYQPALSIISLYRSGRYGHTKKPQQNCFY